MKKKRIITYITLGLVLAAAGAIAQKLGSETSYTQMHVHCNQWHNPGEQCGAMTSTWWNKISKGSYPQPWDTKNGLIFNASDTTTMTAGTANVLKFNSEKGVLYFKEFMDNTLIIFDRMNGHQDTIKIDTKCEFNR